MGQRSLKRALSVIGMSPDINASQWDQRELGKYGLGMERTTKLFYDLFLINPTTRTAEQLCPFVLTGIMHRAFQRYLRPNGLGIDYTALQDYDTRSILQQQATKHAPAAKKYLEDSMRNKNKEGIEHAIYNAQLNGYDKLDPTLVLQASQMLAELGGTA
jgi:hypothetical protein